MTRKFEPEAAKERKPGEIRWLALASLTKEASYMKSGKMGHEEGRSLVWILAQMRAWSRRRHSNASWPSWSSSAVDK